MNPPRLPWIRPACLPRTQALLLYKYALTCLLFAMDGSTRTQPNDAPPYDALLTSPTPPPPLIRAASDRHNAGNSGERARSHGPRIQVWTAQHFMFATFAISSVSDVMGSVSDVIGSVSDVVLLRCLLRWRLESTAFKGAKMYTMDIY
eukprot:4005779-Pyramimonas_sp.AAC.1